MAAFGEMLSELRRSHGLRQSDLVARLTGQFARSTIANVESGREAPSPRLWEALCEAFPDDVDALEDTYLEARRQVGARKGDPLSNGHLAARSGEVVRPLGGVFTVERRVIAYVFRESRAPEEILEFFQVQARQDAVSSYVTKMWATHNEGFRIDPEMLWGGRLVDNEHVDRDGHTFVLREVQFGRPLQHGERHSFAIRSWVEHDADPDTGIDVTPTTPTVRIAIHLAFLGSLPTSVWAYGPVADASLYPRSADEPGARPPLDNGDGRYSVVFERPELGESYGIDWSWD
jgi:transcriptional regulator with XRE-family HTH domain